MKNNLTLLLTLFAMGIFSTQLSAQLVTSEADDGSDGTLRQEIMDTPSGGEITFSSAVESIMLNSEIMIDKELTITGNSENVLIDADQNGRIFNITAGPVILTNLDLMNGLAEDGGAIYIVDANLMMMNSSIMNSVANGESGSGGGIFLAEGSSLDMTDCLFDSNVANRAGGAIEDNSGEGMNIVLTNVDFTSNNAGVAPATAAPGNGGAIHITTAGDIQINGGTANGNIAASEGGAFWNNAGLMTVDGTSLDGNIASGDAADNGGGALFNNGGTMMVMNIMAMNNVADGASGSGGAILNAMGSLTVEDSEFTGNSAQRAGGAIEEASAEGGMLTLTNNDFVENSVAMSPGNGGAVHVGGPGDSMISGGMANGNTAGAEGGAFWNNVGTMTVDGTSFDGNVASGAEADNGGGALYNNGGTMMVMNIMAMNNVADGASGSGGAILNAMGSLTVEDSEFISNSAQRAGGAIEEASAEGGMLTLTNNDFVENSVAMSPGNGGAVHVGGPGDSMISGGMANGNTAGAEGGAFWNNVGTMTVDGTSFDGNVASGADADNGGGALFNNGGTMMVMNISASNNVANGTSGSGGAILNDLGTLTVEDSEFTGNTANRAGGAIEDNSAENGMLTLTDNDFSENTTGSMPGNGGALHITGSGNAMISGGTVSMNEAAAEGGGFWNGAGTMEVDGVNFDANIASGTAADNGGGALFNNGGTLLVSNCGITNNNADGASASGGALFSTDGMVEVSFSTLTGNAANRAGGAIEIVDGDLSVENSDFIDNNVDGRAGMAAPGNGGAIHVTGMSGQIFIVKSSFSANSAGNQGGALWNQSGTLMDVSRCTIDGNTVSGDSEGSGGGGIWNNGGLFNLTASTVSGNETMSSGGGVYNSGSGLIDINACTIALNTAEMNGGGLIDAGLNVTLKNTILALNMADSGDDLSGTVASLGYNIVATDDENSFVPEATDMEGMTPDLGPLADNGGPTFTHALLEGSVGINDGAPGDLFNDQRDYGLTGIRDIGAFEFEGILSIDNASEELFTIYPNPATDWVYFSEDVELERVAIYDINGRSVEVIVNPTKRINVSQLETGMYLISVQTKDGAMAQKVMVE